MAEPVLTKTRISGGRWEGVLRADGEAPPEIEVTHLGQPVSGVAVAPLHGQAGAWQVSVPIPPDLLADGVQTFVIASPGSGTKLAAFSIVTGEPLEDDIRAEINLLRAELDLLKRAFRRRSATTEA